MSHTLRMILGCLVPLIIIFLLPRLGITEGASLMVFVILMFVCHLFMMGAHKGDHQDRETEDSGKGGRHGHT